MIEENIIVKCPHCTLLVQTLVKEFNCKIFRHGVLKVNLEQIDPHLSKKECDQLKENDLIYGCGKPYELVKKEEDWVAIKCEYK
jgi:hypothetical protein